MSDPIENSELLAFSKTVAAKSVSRAARELGVPRATISRRLARLEARLGTRLLRRSTRSLTLTDAGQTLYQHAELVLAAVGHAETSVRRKDNVVRGDLRVSVPPMMSPSFNDFVCDFIEKYPHVRLQLHYASRRVDLIREGYDVALRAGVDLEPGLIARTVSRTPAIAVASPRYLEKHGTPQTRRDLAGHRCLMGFTASELAESHWQFAGGGLHRVEGSFASNDLLMRIQAAARGLGITVVPLRLVEPLLASGRLVHVLPDAIRIDARVAVVYAEREMVAPQVRAFVDAVIAWAPAGLDTDMPECPKPPRARRAASR